MNESLVLGVNFSAHSVGVLRILRSSIVRTVEKPMESRV